MLNKDSYASTQKARPDWCSPSRTTSVAVVAPSLARPGTSRLPQVPEAPVDTHRPREATAVDSAETTIAPACQNLILGPTRSWPTRTSWGVGALG